MLRRFRLLRRKVERLADPTPTPTETEMLEGLSRTAVGYHDPAKCEICRFRNSTT